MENTPDKSSKILNYIKKTYIEFIAIIAIWILIFGKNILSQMLFVDYVPNTFPNLVKILVSSSFTARISLFDIFNNLFSIINIQSIAFQFSILLAMLISYIYIKKISEFKSNSKLFSLLFALIFFFNPFVYARIMIGQVGVILSYLFLPVFMFYLLTLFKDFQPKTAIKAALAAALVSNFQAQYFAFIILIFIITLISFYFSKNSEKDIKKYAKISLIFLAIFIVFNIYLIQGLFSDNIFSSINSQHESFFAPKPDAGISAISKIIGMWGFWRELAYTTPYDKLSSLWYIMLLIIIILLIWGYYNDMNFSHSKTFFAMWWIGILFAAGISHPFTAPIFDFLFKNLPFFNGFRDSHKFLALTAFAYAYFIPIGIYDIAERLKAKKLTNYAIIAIAALFIIAYSYPMINLSSQINSTQYPSSYAELNTFLQTHQTNNYIIYLPWQTYLTYQWTYQTSSDGRIAAPINQIIQAPVLVGPDEFSGQTLIQSKISSCISQKSIQCLQNNNIKYIIKDKCAVYPDNYSWINTNNIFSNSCLDVYELNPSSSVKQTISIIPIIAIQISLLAIIVALIYVIYKKPVKESNQP